jgi:hypothetical protein
MAAHGLTSCPSGDCAATEEDIKPQRTQRKKTNAESISAEPTEGAELEKGELRNSNLKIVLSELGASAVK